MKVSVFIACTLLSAIACAAPDTFSPEAQPIKPLDPMALTVAASQCGDIEAASGARGIARKCIDYTTARFNELESLRENSLMRGYIWGVCAEVSGYTTVLSPQAIGLFSICARVMMNRCNEGRGDGYQLDELSCNRAIRSMAWYGGDHNIKSPKR